MIGPPYTTDTTPDAERVQLELVRRMTGSERADMAITLTNEVIRQSKVAIRHRFPELSEADLKLKFIELHYGRELAEAVRQVQAGVGR